MPRVKYELRYDAEHDIFEILEEYRGRMRYSRLLYPDELAAIIRDADSCMNDRTQAMARAEIAADAASANKESNPS